MHRFSRLCVRQISYLLLVLFLVQLSAVVPVTAQTVDPAPPPTDTTLPKMAYQPPPDADKMEDFVPPGVELVRYEVAKGTDSTYPLSSDKGNALTFNSD